MIKVRNIGYIIFLTSLLLLSACTAESSESEKGSAPGQNGENTAKRTDVNIGIESSPTTLIPNTDPNFVKDLHLKSIFEPLIGRDAEGKMIPYLATEWENIDDLTWKFKLREGVKFHNGEILTPEAVKYSIDYIMDEKNESGYRSTFEPIEEVKIIDDLNFEIITNEPMPTLLVRLADNLILMEPKHMEEVGDGAAEDPIGTGPYQFVEMVRDQSFKMEAFEDYWDGKPEVETINFRVIPEFSARLSAFLSSEIDLLNNLPVDSIDKITDSDIGKIESVSSARVIYLGLNNMNDGPFTNKLIRQAANYAINTDELIEHVLNGQGTKMTGPLSVANEDYVETKAYDYDPEKAKALIEESGLSPEDLKITLETTSGRYPMDDQVMQAIAEQLTAVGFETSVQVNEYSAHVNKIAQGDIGDLFMSSLGTQFDAGGTVESLFLPGSIWLIYTPSEEIQNDIIAAQSIMDTEERKKRYDAIQKWTMEEAAMVPLWQQGDVYALNKDLEYTPRVDQRYMFQDMKWKD